MRGRSRPKSPPHSNRKVRVAPCTPAVIVCCALLTGCAATIRPPAYLTAPANVYVIDHGLHASLVMPTDEGGYAEYAYGEWEWFARNRDHWWRVGPVLFWPTAAGLGSRSLAGPPHVTAGGESPILKIPVEQGKALELNARLQRFIAFSRENEELFNPRHGLTFVPHPEPYWLGSQCNSMIVEWLRELGCRVSGRPLWADFRLDHSPVQRYADGLESEPTGFPDDE